MNNTLKEALYIQCESQLNRRLNSVKTTIANLQDSLQNETKSSAGDKHETGRAMIQLEREKAGNQLAEIQKTKIQLSKIDIEKTASKISLGSLVYTTQANYFIAISAGVLNFEKVDFYAISPLTPIGKLLLGKMVTDVVSFRDNSFKITAIF